MPIEDIDFLYQNSIKENMILLIDSSKRDKYLFPTPSEFQVDFVEPFHFVYGIEVLDTTIPRTTFMVEEYNSTLVFKQGFDLLDTTFDDYRSFQLISQDFSSAEVFFQRFNEQLVHYNISFEIDNFENIFDNSLNEQRKKSDYPVIRFNNDKPFYLDMNMSSIYNVLGFDQIPESNTQKYNNLKSVCNNETPIIKQKPFEKKHSYEFSTVKYYEKLHQSNVSNTDVHDSIVGTLNTFKFKYVHKSKFTAGAFLNSLTLKYMKNDIFSGNAAIYVSVKNNTTNKVVFNNLANDIFNKTISDVELPYNNGINFFPTISNTNFILKRDNEYEITISNVYLSKTDESIFDFHITIGFAYYINLHNIDLTNDKLFFSRPIYDTVETNATIYHSSDSDNLTQTNINVPHTFHLDFSDISNSIFDYYKSTLSIYPTSTIKSFDLKVIPDPNIDENDIFTLSITRTNILSNTTSFIGTLVLQYSYDSESESAYLRCNLTNIDNNVFSFIHINTSMDPDSSEYIENIKLTFNLVCCTKQVQLIGNNVDGLDYNITFTFFKEFGLVSPGMLNLASENYIILRCDEVENHLRGSYDVKDLSPGLGVLNIDVQGYASGRTEFYSVNYKEFHPIGKLNKLKFRFERKSDGKLYDFKNVDLHFIMTIKYLRPKQKQFFEQSVLNPNYNPNYLGYFNKTLQDMYDEESSDESDIDESYFTKDFNDTENRMLLKDKNRMQDM